MRILHYVTIYGILQYFFFMCKKLLIKKLSRIQQYTPSALLTVDDFEKEETMRKFGNSEFSAQPTNFYNLDMIISVGYRVCSQRGVQFRIWASAIIKEYMKKGFTMDDGRQMRQVSFLIYYDNKKTCRKAMQQARKEISRGQAYDNE